MHEAADCGGSTNHHNLTILRRGFERSPAKYPRCPVRSQYQRERPGVACKNEGARGKYRDEGRYVGIVGIIYEANVSPGIVKIGDDLSSDVRQNVGLSYGRFRRTAQSEHGCERER